MSTSAPSSSNTTCTTTAEQSPSSPIEIRKGTNESEIPLLDALIVKAFSAHFGRDIGSDASFAHRCMNRSCKVWVAESGSKIVGVIYLTMWGSFAFFGPVCIEPTMWGRGIAQKLVAAAMDAAKTEGVKGVAIFTMPDSTKHIHLYSKFNLTPRFLTMLGVKKLNRTEAATKPPPPAYHRFSQMHQPEKEVALADMRSLTNGIYAGLDLAAEMEHVISHGEGILLVKNAQLVAFAICHYGPASEGGTQQMFIKFAIAKEGEHFNELLVVIESWANWNGAPALLAGFNYAREEAIAAGLAFGFRAVSMGVMLHQNNDPMHARKGIWIIEDLR